jgi:hypothetical protein
LQEWRGVSERLNATTESWRPQRRNALLDPQVIRLALIAGGVIVATGIGVAGYSYVARRPHVVPVIEADSRPLRVRPDNPGGMQVAGAEEQSVGGSGSGQADAMAPASEAPQLAALRAQIQAAHEVAPAPAQPVPLAAPLVPPPAAIAAAPDTRPPAAPAAMHPPAHAVAIAQPGGTAVQLAALGSEQAAMTEWQRLAKRMPELLGSHQPAVLRAERDGKPIWRLRTSGFTDLAQATIFCTQVRAKGAGCAIASF